MNGNLSRRMATPSDTTIVTCDACGQRNRVAPGREARCGRCKQPLLVDHVVVVTDQNFSAEVEASPLPVLLDCWAPWCGPCRAVAPVVEEIATELAGRVKVAKLNTDENMYSATRFNISSIPSLLLFRKGQLVGRIVGAQPKMAILGELRQKGFL